MNPSSTVVACVACITGILGCQRPHGSNKSAPSVVATAAPRRSATGVGCAPAAVSVPLSVPVPRWQHSNASFLNGSPLTILMHVDLPYQLMKGKSFERENDCHASLRRLQLGHIGGFAAVLFVDDDYQEHGTVGYCKRAEAQIDAILTRHQDVMAAALTADDFTRNYSAGRISVFRTMEGSWCLQGKLSSIDQYHGLGVRMIGLTWKDDDAFATSWNYHGSRGLTPLGRQAVRRMNELGIIVDVSHMSDAAIRDVLDVSEAPIFASHSNARAISKHARNLTDEQIRRIARSGGVIGVTFFRFHLRRRGSPNVDDVVAHIKHLRDVGGLGVVALGSDFDGIRHGPLGLEDTSKLPNLRRALLKDGFTPKQIRAIFGGNFLRALRDVQRRRRP